MASDQGRAGEEGRKDLVVLTADLNTENTFKGLLSRPEALGISPVRHDIFRHPDKDPGCFHRAPDLADA